MISRLLGRLLRGRSAGESTLLWNHPLVAGAPHSLALGSPSFGESEFIPLACAGKGVGDSCSPALFWENIPEGTRELLLIIEDADAPLPKPFVHLIAYGISPQLAGIPETALVHPQNPYAEIGRNTFGSTAYVGPRALPGHGPHRYSFQLLALNRTLRFDGRPSRRDVLAQLDGAVIARGRLDGLFERI